MGAYFTTMASKADYYTDLFSHGGQSSSRVIFVARVALGEIHEAKTCDSSLRRPPVRNDGLRFDSVLGVPRSRGGRVDHDEFIVYERKQCCPQFAIVYRHKPTCRC